MTPNPQDSAVALEVERAAFETWAADQGFPLQPTVHGGEYQDYRTQSAWEGYQARASQSDGTSGGWRPIETAPKDGTRVLAWSNSYGARETYWRLYGDGSIAKQEFLAGKGPSGAWEWSEPQNHWAASWRPTHWQTLAAAPTQSQGDNHVG